MGTFKLRSAAEISAVTDRINNALATLKTDLIAMRSQDVKLMRQMIHINETIQRMSKKCHRRSGSNLATSIPNAPLTNTLLIRRQSDPTCITNLKTDNSGSLESIFEDGCSLDGMSCSDSSCDSSSDSDSDECGDGPVFSSLVVLPGLTRPRSMTHVPLENIEDFVSEESYEDILKTNIKLWKHSQSDYL